MCFIRIVLIAFITQKAIDKLLVFDSFAEVK